MRVRENYRLWFWVTMNLISLCRESRVVVGVVVWEMRFDVLDVSSPPPFSRAVWVDVDDKVRLLGCRRLNLERRLGCCGRLQGGLMTFERGNQVAVVCVGSSQERSQLMLRFSDC